MSYSIEIVTQPAREAVELNDVRRHIKASSNDDNFSISLIVEAARHYIEKASGRYLINTEMKMYLNEWGSGEMPWWDGMREGAFVDQADYIEIPYGPLQSVTHIKTYDDTDTATTWASTNYFVDNRKQDLGRIKPRSGQSWPVFTRPTNGIEIQFVAGYGETAKDVPANVKLALMMQCAHLYQNRGDLITGSIVTEAPRGVEDLINQFKIKRLGL